MPHFDELALMSLGVDSDGRSVTPDERRDAASEVLTTLLRGGLDLPSLSDVEETLPILAKASVIEPAWQQYTIGERKTPTHTAVIALNEYGLVERGSGDSRWLEKGYAAGFPFLRDVVSGTDLIQAIIRTRVRQVFAFLVPEREEGAAGFRIARKHGEELDEADQEAARDLEDFILDSGDEHDRCRRDRLRRDDLEGFVTKIVWDSLTADACPIELVRTRGGKLTGYHALDFASIRLCSEAGYQGDDEIRAVQLIDATPYATFGFDDLLYHVRTPRTDLRSGGYGYAEVEGIVKAVTGYINAVTYNEGGISRSSLPRGVMTVFGEYDRLQQQAFSRQWRAMLTGAGNRHNIPTLFSKSKEAGIGWTPIDTFNEMLFARWITLLVSICSAQYGINPEEIHFDTFSTRSSALGGKGDTAEKLSHSYDKGLVPLLRFVEKILATLVELRSENRFTFRFVGIEPEDADKKHERIKLSRTIDELRAMDGEEPHENEVLGKAPANPSLTMLYMQTMQQQGQDGAATQEGEGDSPEFDFGSAEEDGEPPGDDEDYPVGPDGRHAPYGDDAPPEEDHFHSLEFGKAVRPWAPRRKGHFRAVVVQSGAFDE